VVISYTVDPVVTSTFHVDLSLIGRLKTCLFLQFYSSWGGISPDVSSQTWNLCRFCFHAYGFRDMRLFSYLRGS